MAFALHPLLSTYPGASFFPNGNLNGPHLAVQSGGPSSGYWGQVPWNLPEFPEWGLPPAIIAAQEGRGTGVYGYTLEGGGQGMRFDYGWPKYGPMPLRPELGGFVGKTNPFGRSFPHGFYKTTY
ncbi:hypothetical protein L486_05657 [Kwoniella mangroviensis CBS 10435]|uniref:Uncharacterized protein n=1 Tax=Kwoniella mangroviensis CBS 10435 TaxID=1331196 RepID=A0A1B9IMK7_9TREE|nr:uncharacterized protein I203_07304 [Kwoniella mangroviensis CBS 8507]OCF56802.1 hypothetical protein L486_05657 [Kwoniella mangroviensis CBS 10435]OCF63606.1 hypothetical protein I203_07304 [Kwoniella mangroviensis CBS 8507]